MMLAARLYCWLWHGVVLNDHYLISIRCKTHFVKCPKCQMIFEKKVWP